MRIYINRSLLCTHAFHRTNSKDLDIHVLDHSRWVNAGNKNTPNMHHLWRQNVTGLKIHDYGWIKKKVTYAKTSSKNGEPQWHCWEMKICWKSLHTHTHTRARAWIFGLRTTTPWLIWDKRHAWTTLSTVFFLTWSLQPTPYLRRVTKCSLLLTTKL